MWFSCTLRTVGTHLTAGEFSVAVHRSCGGRLSLTAGLESFHWLSSRDSTAYPTLLQLDPLPALASPARPPGRATRARPERPFSRVRAGGLARAETDRS